MIRINSYTIDETGGTITAPITRFLGVRQVDGKIKIWTEVDDTKEPQEYGFLIATDEKDDILADTGTSSHLFSYFTYLGMVGRKHMAFVYYVNLNSYGKVLTEDMGWREHYIRHYNTIQ